MSLRCSTNTRCCVEELRVRADRHQRERLLKFAAPYVPRVWAIEGARGLGALLAQQLVAAGETVVDVPAKLSARVRSLDNECCGQERQPTTRVRPRSSGCTTAARYRSRPRTMRWCCGCSPNGIMT